MNISSSRLPTHHPGDALLLDYVGGALSEGAALAVATHMALCPECRHAAREMEAVGGALLERLEPDPFDPASLERMMARLDEPAPPPAPLTPAGRGAASPSRSPSPDGKDGPLLPQPLRGYLGGDPAALSWRRMTPGVVCLSVPTGGSARVRLLRCQGGAKLPEHTHHGQELSLVLEGSFSDGHARFRRGDLGIGDESLRHRPVADAEGCVSLLVIDGAIRLTGPFGRFINRFIRI